MLTFLQIIKGGFHKGDSEDCDNCDDQPILTEIFVFARPTTRSQEAAAAAAAATPRGGRAASAGNLGKEETMHLFRIAEEQLLIGSEG